ncbi:MAG TPA: hypothetical protein VGR14_09605 [Verrucomicrobiae bacterium]|nr:hypothetical protein [Verrucomicrobiae bacterium]
MADLDAGPHEFTARVEQKGLAVCGASSVGVSVPPKAFPGASGYLTNGILATVRIWCVQRTGRVITPPSINQKSIVVWARLEFNRDVPSAVQAPMQINGTLLPAREIAH